jgi:hypothetical protein
VEGFVKSFSGWSKKDSQNGGDKRPSLIIYDELKSFVDKARQKGSTLLPFMTSMFENESYDNTTVTKQISIQGCHISLLGACTLDTFADMWTSEFSSIGFPNRLFLVQGDPHQLISYPVYPPSDQVDALRQRAFALVEQIKVRHQSGKGRIPLDSKAQATWDEYYTTSMPRSVHSKRLDTYAFKWMMLLALSQEQFEIDRDTVERAISLIEYQFKLRKLYDPVDTDNEYASMEEKIRRFVIAARPGVLSRRDLVQKTNANRKGVYLFDNAIGNLIKSGEIVQDGSRKAWRCAEDV